MIPQKRHRRTGRPLPLLLGLVAAGLPFADARAQQMIDSFFPTGNSGFDQQLGVTVMTRARPLYEPEGIRLGSFLLRPNFDQSFGYDTAPNGAGSPDTFVSRTAASATIGSTWSRDGLGATVGILHNAYFSAPSLDYTDWNAGLTGAYTIGDSQLAASYSHQTYHVLGTTIGNVATSTPLMTQTDSGQVSYTFNLGRFAITPDMSVSAYRYGNATIDGLSQNQNYLNYNALSGGLTTRYSLSDAGGLLLVFRGTNGNYTNPVAGQPSNDFTSYLVAAGIDYQAKGPWRYQILVGGEIRTFTASQYKSRTSPIVQANVIWTPIELTTVVATLSRTIEAAGSSESSGYVLTTGQIKVNHELRRNIILEGRVGVQYAEYIDAGNQTNAFFGGGVSWLLNRNLRLSLDYNFTRQSNPGTVFNPANPNTLTSGSYSQNVVLAGVHVAF